MKQCANPHCENPWLPATPEYFSRNKNHKDGLQTLCKVCMKAYKKQHYQTHKEEINQKNKAYREAHKEQVAEHQKTYAEAHRDHIQAYHQQYYQDRKEQWSEWGKFYYQEHREQKIAYQRSYAEAHREHILEYKRRYSKAHKEQRKLYYHTHREHVLAQKKYDYQKHKVQRYEKYKLYRKTERGRLIRRALWHKREAQKKALGGSYTAQDIQRQYQRQKGVCYWCHNKLTEYHIDHVVPLARGGSNGPDNLVVACPRCNTSRKARLPHEWPEGGKLL